MKAQDIREGFDIGLEMSGNPKAFNDMLHHMYHGGRVALLGILPDGHPHRLGPGDLQGPALKGIYGREMFETWYKMTQMMLGGLDLRPVLTHQLPIEEFQKGFDLMATGQCGKVVLSWN